jgi:hypothetical protein
MQVTIGILAVMVIGLILYVARLQRQIDYYRTDLNDIFDRIRAWRKAGCSDERSFWLLSDIFGLISRRMGNHADFQRSTVEEDRD